MSNQSEQINELASALAKAQGQLKPAAKDSTNPHFRSKYADLQSIWEAARPVLMPNNLSVVQGFEPGNGETVTVWTMLMHSSGQWMRSALTLRPTKADPQGIGSAATYGKRYGLAAILGIVADEDDDGNAASLAPKPLTAETRKALEFFKGTAKGLQLLDKVLARKHAATIDELDEDTGHKAIEWINGQLAKETSK